VKRIPWTAPFLLALAAALAGCSPGGTELARVGGSVITRDDFEAAARTNGRIYLALGDSARSVLLDDLVKRLLLVEAAKRQGLYRDSLFLEYAKNIREQVLRGALVKELAGDVQVSVGEARAFYDRQGIEGRCRVVFVPTRELAEAAKRELDRGTDFATVADHFNSGGQLPPGGDVGWVKGGSLVRSLDEALVSGPVGKVVGPVEQPTVGWFLMKVEGRRQAKQEPFESMREQITSALTQRKRTAALQKRAAWMLQSEQVTLTPGATQMLSSRLREAGDQMRSDPTVRRPRIVLTGPEQAFVLARWQRGTLTLGEAAAAIDHGADPPNAMMLPMVEHWIQDQVLQRILIQEAETRRLADEPANARTIRERENQYLLESFYTKEVSEQVTVSDQELRSLRQAQAAHGEPRLENADLVLAMVPDSAGALRVVDHGAHGGTLQHAVAMAGVQAQPGPFSIQFPNEQPLWRTLEPRINAMRPGEISGPFHTPMGWLVIQLLTATRTSDTYENLPPALVENLRNTLLERKREVRFQAVSDSLRRVIPWTVNRAALAKTPWPAMDPSHPEALGG
jgi:peptidyl-prolyl cis-trans isomerase C